MGVAVAPLILRRFAPQDKLVGPANAITLSCKDRLPCRPQESGATAAATNTEWQERTGSRRDAGVQFGAAPGGSAAEPRLGGFCQLVRAVSPLLRRASTRLASWCELDVELFDLTVMNIDCHVVNHRNRLTPIQAWLKSPFVDR